MLQLHLSGQQVYFLLKCGLYIAVWQYLCHLSVEKLYENPRWFYFSSNEFNTRRVTTLLSFPAAGPTNGISIEFEILSKFAVLWFEMRSADPNEILHTSWQCYCHDGCKTSMRSAKYEMDKSITKFHRISNSIKIPIVGQVPEHCCSNLPASCLLPPPDNKVHGANMGPTWVPSAPYGPHFGPMNLAIRAIPPDTSLLTASVGSLWNAIMKHPGVYSTLSWCVQNFIGISWAHFKPEHCKFW